MKMRRLRLFSSIMLLCIGLVFSGCKKFEEDEEWIHFRTVKKRIEGLKELTMYTLGPTNLLPYWHERFGDFYLDFSLYSYNPYKEGYGYKVYVYKKGSNEKICEGQWGFLGNRRSVFFHFSCLDADTTSSFPNYLHGTTSEIIKLSNKEMWLKAEQAWHDGFKIIVPQEVRFIEYKK